MARYTGVETCPKCLKKMDETNQGINRTWCGPVTPNGPNNRKANCNLPPEDDTTQHLHLTCLGCSYLWFVDPADAP